MFSLLLVTIMIPSCSRPYLLQKQQTQKALERIDALEVRGLRINDERIIRGLKQIHDRAKWDPLPITLPADTIAVSGLSQDQEQFRLLLGAGWIMDTDQDGLVTRLAELSAEDWKWVKRNIHSKLPNGQ